MPRFGAALVVLVLSVPSRPSFAEPDSEYSEYCPEDGVVGRRRCPPYGEWGAALESPYVIVRFGVNMRRLPGTGTPPTAATAAQTKAMVAQRSTTNPSTQFPEEAGTNYSVSEQIAVSTSSATYLAFEVEVSPTTTDQVPPGTRAFAAASHLVFGLHVGTKALSLGGEIAGGVRLIDTTEADAGEEPVLEVRGRGDFWLSPWITLGAAVGKSVIEKNDWFTGISLGIHSYAFGGG